MKTKTILVPKDFSQHSKMVLRYAESLARDREAKLPIVHVKEPPPYFPPANHGVEDSGRGEENERLAKVIPSDPAIRYAHRMLAGDPADEIVRLANKKRVEMIVMATHGRTGLSRLLKGSVAKTVVRKAKCPVLTLREPVKGLGDAGNAR